MTLVSDYHFKDSSKAYILEHHVLGFDEWSGLGVKLVDDGYVLNLKIISRTHVKLYHKIGQYLVIP